MDNKDKFTLQEALEVIAKHMKSLAKMDGIECKEPEETTKPGEETTEKTSKEKSKEVSEKTDKPYEISKVTE